MISALGQGRHKKWCSLRRPDYTGECDCRIRKGYQLVPKEPTHRMLKALAGDPLILAVTEEEELRRRYYAALDRSPVK